MKKVLFSFFALIMMALMFGCAADIILEEPETLDGDYIGEYIYRARGSGVTEDTSIQRITWRFVGDSLTWGMNIDFEHPDFNTDFCICESFGKFLLEDRLRLQEKKWTPNGDLCSSCNPSTNPEGLFLLDRSTGALKMTQQITTADSIIVKQFVLNKIVDTTSSK